MLEVYLGFALYFEHVIALASTYFAELCLALKTMSQAPLL
jgi:hypothetical protein